MITEYEKKLIYKVIIVWVIITYQIFFHQLIVEANGYHPSIVHLRILETTDLHGNIVNYDYQMGSEVNDFGLVRTASLIKKARQDAFNTLLFDNGDLLQGNAMMDYVAMKEVMNLGEVHPMIKAMNILGYDAATLGNHDFHYGLPFLQQAISGANFPFVNANMYLNTDFDTFHLFNPYVILDREVTDINGMTHHLKIGVIGFITPYVLKWEKHALMDNISAQDIVTSAEKYISKMKSEGADIIITLAHTGISLFANPYLEEQNVILPLSHVKGIDAILFGHTHVIFPDRSRLKGVPGIDNQKGTINGVPAVQAGSWGSYLGIIDLILEQKKGKWMTIQSQSSTRPIFKLENNKKKAVVPTDPDIMKAVKQIHRETIDYVNLHRKKGLH